VLDPAIPVPTEGRTFSARRRVGLADLDRYGRVRLDAIARILQDVAIDDPDPPADATAVRWPLRSGH